MMDAEQADATMQAAIRAATEHQLVGGFVVVATVYDPETGEAHTAIQSPEGMTMPEQIGLLTSALNRANAIDLQGWERIGGEDA